MNKISYNNLRSKNNELLKFDVDKFIDKQTARIKKKLYVQKRINLKKIKFHEIDLFCEKKIKKDLSKYFNQIFLINYLDLKKDKKIEVENKLHYNILKNLFPQNIFILKSNAVKVFANYIKKKIKKLLVREINLNMKQKKSKISVEYLEGFDPYKKNDLYWLDKANLHSREVLIYFSDEYYINRFDTKCVGEAKNFYKKKGIKLVNLKKFNFRYKNIPDIKEFKNFIDDKKYNNNFYKLYLYKIILDLNQKIIFWYSFFNYYNIKINISQIEDDIDLIPKKISLDLLEGCTMKRVRSFLTGDDPRVSGWYNEDIIFCWGNDFKTKIKKTRNYFQTIITTGFIKNYKICKISYNKKIKNFLDLNKKNNFLILDNATSDNNEVNFKKGETQLILKDDMRKFYIETIGLLLKINSKNKIVIKSKKNYLIETDLKLKKYIDNLVEQKKCYLINDSFNYPVENLVNNFQNVISIGIYFPTVLIECLLSNKKINTYYYDYGNLKNKEKLFYKYLDNLVFFESLDNLLMCLNKNINGNVSNYKSWNNILKKINSFNDDYGSKRFSLYIENLFKNLNKYSKIISIKKTNKLYAKKFGYNHISKL